MTNKEQESINDLYKLLSDIRKENQKFRDDIANQVTTINNKVEQKHIPITLESDILQVLQHSMNKAIESALTGYSNPLDKLVTVVVDQHSDQLKHIISGSFSEAISTEDFKQSIVEAFSHKIARTLISNNDGLFDRVSNELRQDAMFKAKMALAVANVVEECLNVNK